MDRIDALNCFYHLIGTAKSANATLWDKCGNYEMFKSNEIVIKNADKAYNKLRELT